MFGKLKIRIPINIILSSRITLAIDTINGFKGTSGNLFKYYYSIKMSGVRRTTLIMYSFEHTRRNHHNINRLFQIAHNEYKYIYIYIILH